jgi:chorismate dehydratase
VARFTVGSVPYLNAKPLVKPFQWAGPDSDVEVLFAIPSLLPKMMEEKTVQAILVSSIAALTDPRCTVAEGLSIGTQREVVSVRIFSKVPFEQISSLAEDQSSMTSNALAKIILAERFGAYPKSKALPPVPQSMLEKCDACVLIGDNGMRFEGDGLNILDLGRSWFDLTLLPFVWAVWKSDESLSPHLVSELQNALEASRNQEERVIREASQETGFSFSECNHYLTQIMDYRLTQAHLKGLNEFGNLLLKHGLVDEVFNPRIVKASPRHALA